ncbi:hypothetical protein JCM1841_000768 [Sporobolomyces salmonicolor]
MDGRSDDGPPRLATRDEAGEEVWAAPIGQSGVEECDKDARKRLVMLVCACLLGVGPHFGSYVLGPIKKSLKTTESGFAALISAFELLNTVTPLISGFLVPRYGAARVGLAATGAVLLGQIIVCLAQGDDDVVGSNMGGMIAGLLLFGSGISPLAVVQETVILSNNPSGSRFVARSVAIGLVFGKTSSFLAGSSSDWLHSVSPRMPFIAASGFAALSFAACVIYALMERSLHHSAPSHPTQHSEALEHKHRTLPLSELARFGDPFWLYIAVCGFAGIWYTTIHLSTHLLQAVYGIDQSDASSAASVLLLSASFLYPTLGWLLDKRPSLLSTIYLMVPSGIAISYFILLFLPSIIPYKAAFVPAALGIGGGPLLLVLVVPRMVQRHQAATALGVHKSLEMSGAIIFQSLAGYLFSLGSSGLSSRPSSPFSPTSLDDDTDDADFALMLLLVAALVQLALVASFWNVMRRRGKDAIGNAKGFEADDAASAGARDLRRRPEEEYGLLASAESDDDHRPAPRTRIDGGSVLADDEVDEAGRGEEGGGVPGSRKDEEEIERGRHAMKGAVGVVLTSWVCFVWNLVR